VPPPPDLPKPDKLPAPEGLKLFLRVELESRLAMAKTVDPSLKEEAVKNMSQDDYIRLIRPKLKEHIANAVREKLGDSFPFDGEPQSDTDFGHHSKHSFWLPLSVRNVDEEKALKKIKGEELAGNFSQFLASLNKLATGGVGGLAAVATDLRATVRHSQLKELHTESKVSLRLEISHAVLPNFFMQKFRPSAAPPTNGSRNMLPVASAAEARRQAPGENPQMRCSGWLRTSLQGPMAHLAFALQSRRRNRRARLPRRLMKRSCCTIDRTLSAITLPSSTALTRSRLSKLRRSSPAVNPEP